MVTVRVMLSSESDFSLREVVNVCLSGDDDGWVSQLALLVRIRAVNAATSIIVVHLMLSKCPAHTGPVISRPVTSGTGNIAAQLVSLTSTTTRDKVTSRSTKFGVDDEIENKVDGEV